MKNGALHINSDLSVEIILWVSSNPNRNLKTSVMQDRCDTSTLRYSFDLAKHTDLRLCLNITLIGLFSELR